MDDSDNSDFVEMMKNAITAIFNSAVSNLTESHLELKSKNAEKQIFFPNGVNYIKVSLDIDPTKPTFSANLTVSSDPEKAGAEPRLGEVGDNRSNVEKN